MLMYRSDLMFVFVCASYLPFCVYKIQSHALGEKATLIVLENKGVGTNVQIHGEEVIVGWERSVVSN
jgi:hypothetical protein